MITLTNSIDLLAVLGGTATVGYESVVLLSLNVNTAIDSANGLVELRSSTTNRPPIQGNLQIRTNADPSIVLEFPELGFFKKLGLSAAQASTVSNIFQTLKSDVESGLVSLGLVDGVQS